MNNQFTWNFSQHAYKSFRKLDLVVRRRIIKWLNSHIEGCSNPKVWGHILHGNLGDLWRYRVGKYRVIAKIKYHVFTVTVVKAGKRGQIYK